MNVPLVNKDGGIGLTATPAHGVEVSADQIEGETPDVPGTRLTFNNPRTDRRVAALEGLPAGTIEGARVLAFDCQLTTRSNRHRDPWGPPPPSIVALFFENDQLDLEQVSYVAIGMHGTASAASSGMINISSPQFVP